MCRKVLISCKNVLNKCLFFWTPCIQPSSRAYIFPVRIKEKIIFMAGVSLHLTCQHIFTMFYLNLYLYKLQNFKYLKNRKSERKKERMCKKYAFREKAFNWGHSSCLKNVRLDQYNHFPVCWIKQTNTDKQSLYIKETMLNLVRDIYNLTAIPFFA